MMISINDGQRSEKLLTSRAPLQFIIRKEDKIFKSELSIPCWNKPTRSQFRKILRLARKNAVAAFKLVGAKLGAPGWENDPCLRETWNDTSISRIYTSENLGNGIFCDCSFNDNTTCHITSIVMREQNFSGTLPPELAQLKFLNTIDLQRNYLNGTIPSEWMSLPLINLTLHGNRISGAIPKEIGNLTSLVVLFLESNELEGSLPEELGNLENLERMMIGGNKFSGNLPTSMSKLVNLKDLRLHGNNFSGRIPSFLENLTSLRTLMLFGNQLEGPIPEGIYLLGNLTDLRISDISSPDSPFPNLGNMINMRSIVLRNCSLSGEIPDYFDSMTNLRTLDVSFNKLTGEIPSSLQNLPALEFLYLKNNMLTGSIPVWTLQSSRNSDFSNNNFTGATNSTYCPLGNLNLVGSYSSATDKSIQPCSRKDFPCAGKAKYSSFFINCGGSESTVDGVKYDADLELLGAATYYQKGNWAFSSMGNYMGDNPMNDNYVVSNTSELSLPASELYTTARASAISLTYYGLCLQNGLYNVKLHFAEIIFTEDKTFSSVGRRIFDVYIQGECVLKDFNIEDEAGGVGKELVRNFVANVTENVLQIHFYWAGKGTVSIPHRGIHGPLISAIAVTPKFKPITNNDEKRPSLLLVSIIIGGIIACILIILVVAVLFIKGCSGGKLNGSRGSVISNF